MDQESIFSRCPKFHELDLIEGNGKIARIFEKGASKWDKIATRLYFEGNKIAQIQADCQHTFQACQKTFTVWLDGKEGLRRPTAWSTVITALKEADLGQLAGDLEEILQTLEKDSASPKESKSTNIATSSAHALVPTPHQTFPLLKRTIPAISSENYQKLQTRLYSESVSLTENFGRMFNSFFQSLSDRCISIKKIVANLKAFGAYSPVYGGGNQPLLRDELHADRLDLATADIDDIKLIILEYCSFFNYRLISSLVASFGTESDQMQLEKYEVEFKEYAKRRIYECPSEFGKLNSTNAILTVKLDSHYERCSLNQLKLLEVDFCNILNISNLNLCLVTSGCLQLTFQLPWFVQNKVFPLSQEQEEKLTALHIQRIICGYYHFTVKTTMPDKTLLTQLDTLKLTGVIVTSNVLGHGSYATILELQYMGLKCAGKKIHEVLLRQGASVQKFDELCRLLSQVRHPNIVQFLGTCNQNSEEVPILVMEFLPINLTSCIEEYGILQQEICYSILHDVALGLCYLHGQTPPIIHRHLSSNNILLTTNMMAKISNVGVASILNLTPLQVSHMMQAPDTSAYMSPEVMVENPEYNVSMDEFSYGILMIHVLSGSWPDSQVGPTQSKPGKLKAGRYAMFLEAIGRDHPLMNLILKCIDNDPEKRIHANMIVKELNEMVAQFPILFKNKLQMQKFIQVSEEDKRALTEVEQMRADSEIIKRKEEEIRNLTQRLQSTLESETNEKQRMKLAHSVEVEELQFQIQHIRANLRATNTEKVMVCNKLSEQQKKLNRLQAENEALISTKMVLEEKAAMTDARVKRHIEDVKEELLQKKDVTTAKNQASITWEQCADLPFATAAGQSTVINEKVYFGGGKTDAKNKRYLVHCYSPTENRWTTLPPLPVKWFGLDQINGKPVAVGGVTKDKKIWANVYIFDSHKWKGTVIPPMILARSFPAVSSFNKLLIVAGGNIEGGYSTNTVEIFQQATTQWHQAATLPKACCNLSLINTGGTLYALGGYDQQSLLNQVLYTSIDNLLEVQDPTKSVWSPIQSSPTYQPAVAVLSDNLLSVGGWQLPKGEIAQKSIHMYSSTNDHWVYFSKLPEPCAWTTCAVLSATEILVIGGRNEEKVRAVYKGTLTVKA